MMTRHKTQAITGVTVWFAAIPLMFILGAIVVKINPSVKEHDPILGLLFLIFLAVQYVAFFWGGTHLATAKGYSTGMLAFGIFWPAQMVVLLILLFALPDKYASPSRSKSKSQRHESHIARVVRYRRNALVFNSLGVAGALLALALIFVRIGFFDDPANARVIAIFVFIAGYACIIYGCWWWVRAKHWNEAVVFIGLAPLAPLVVPFVRIIYLATGVLPLMMAIMPLIMIGVVAVLPDKSGMSSRKR